MIQGVWIRKQVRKMQEGVKKTFYIKNGAKTKIDQVLDWFKLTYLLLGNFKGFQVVTNDAQLFFKLNDFAEIKCQS